MWWLIFSSVLVYWLITLKRQVWLLRDIGFRCWSDETQHFLFFFFLLKFPSTLWHIQYWLSQFRLFVSTCMVWCSCLPYYPPSGVKHLLFSSLTPRKMIDHVSFMAKLIILTFLTLLWKNNQTKRSLRSLTEEIVPVWRSFKS